MRTRTKTAYVVADFVLVAVMAGVVGFFAGKGCLSKGLTESVSTEPARGERAVFPQQSAATPEQRQADPHHPPEDRREVHHPLAPSSPLEPGPEVEMMRRIVRAIDQVESLRGQVMIGDLGLARGRLHRHRDHWERGCEFLGVNWRWPDDTDDYEKCTHVAMANWCRDSMEYVLAGNVDELIRRFRLPFDPYREDNDAYVRKVRAAIAEAAG